MERNYKRLFKEDYMKFQKYHLYVDLDGVLVDLDKGIEDIGFYPAEEYYDKEELWDTIKSIPYFWAELHFMRGGVGVLWEYIKDHNPVILSSPIDDINCRKGKIEWVYNWLGSHVPVILEKEKYIHAKPDRILIDDRESVINDWVKAGGVGILHTGVSSTVNKLKEFGF